MSGKKLIKKIIDKSFEIGILLKSIFGFFEILGGVIIIVSGKLIVNNFIIGLVRTEISKDPDDLVANFLIKSANSLYRHGHLFAIIYLIAHGIINIFLAVSLVKNKLWAYPLAIAGFSVFIVYQTYRYFYNHSWFILFLTIFDILVVLFILLEYNSKRKIKKNAENNK